MILSKIKVTSYLLLFVCIIITVESKGQSQYSAELDITKIENDQISIEVKTPKIDEKNLLYVFPMIVPGTYDQSDYGRFISNFKAFDENGKKVKAKKNDVNSYKIKKADKVASVKYTVDDTWDAFGDNYIFQPGGVNFEAGKQFSFNNFGLFGYFNGYSNLPYQVTVHKPTDFYGATSLDKINSTPSKDVFMAENYVELVDQPIMYNVPDTATYYEDGAKIVIAVYSDGPTLSAQTIKETVMPITKATSFILGNIPTDEYWFLFYFFDLDDPVFRRGGGAMGALEHKKSSFYFLPNIPGANGIDTASMINTISSVAAHEFLHILSPLNLHSEEIAYFDFYETELSKHLWLYEGVTEYLSIKSRLIGGLMSMEEFMAEMQGKIKQANRFKDVSFTEMSKNITTEENAKQYINVYMKGALIAMMLDIKIAKNTQGKEDLIDLVLELIDDYGIEKPFKDDEIIGVITDKTSPEIGAFFDKHVIGAEPIPYNEIMNEAGLEYVSQAVDDAYTFGEITPEFDSEKGLLYLNPSESNNIIKERIAVKELNGEELSFRAVQTLLMNPKTDAPLTIGHVKNGKLEELVVQPIMGTGNEEYVVKKKSIIEPDEITIYNKIFTKGNR